MHNRKFFIGQLAPLQGSYGSQTLKAGKDDRIQCSAAKSPWAGSQAVDTCRRLLFMAVKWSITDWPGLKWHGPEHAINYKIYSHSQGSFFPPECPHLSVRLTFLSSLGSDVINTQVLPARIMCCSTCHVMLGKRKSIEAYHFLLGGLRDPSVLWPGWEEFIPSWYSYFVLFNRIFFLFHWH